MDEPAGDVRVGVVVLPDRRWAEARDRWVGAEELGFDHAWTYDHLAWRSLPRRPLVRRRAHAGGGGHGDDHDLAGLPGGVAQLPPSGDLRAR